MTAAREQRLVFGEDADAYERARPGYPSAALDEITARLALPMPARVLEVGAGTGKWTRTLAAAGHEVVAVEPSEEMAAVALRRVSPSERVRVEVASFEDVDLPAGAFDLVTAAQAWHWVDRDVALPKAQAALGPEGGLALLWNFEVGPPPDLREALDAVYQERAPSMIKEPLKVRVGDAIADELAASPQFGPVARQELPWEREHTTASYLDLLGTHSDHRMLADDQRQCLHEGIAAAVDAHGGRFTVRYATTLLIAARGGYPASQRASER